MPKAKKVLLRVLFYFIHTRTSSRHHRVQVLNSDLFFLAFASSHTLPSQPLRIDFCLADNDSYAVVRNGPQSQAV